MALAVTLGSALIVVTCGTRREVAPPPAAPPADTLAQSPARASSESQAPPLLTALPAEPSASAAPAPTAEAPAIPVDPRAPGHELDRFYAALRDLEKHTRKQHVRAAWLGDSHGAADLWSGPLRAALQARFGDAGPGFVHAGYKANRHEGMKIEVKGRWSVHPRGPSTAVRTGDGTFGLGGVVVSGAEDNPRVTLTVADPALPPTLSWDLCYKPATDHDELELAATGLPDRVLKADPSGPPLGALRHFGFTTTTASPSLRLVPLGGHPGLCGVAIETDPATQPGVVLDTLGINGARLTTPLAWDEAAWVAEVARRPPLLAILEYGTNESGDHTIVAERYVDHLKRLMARIHAASPDCDCLVLAPTDRADTLEKTPLVRDALREAARVSGCGFWDTYAIMGGKASIVAWHAESPPRAGADGVHLTARGYNDLGVRLAADVLAGYRP